MKNTKSIALITFSAIQLTSFAISAQQVPNGFTKQNVQQKIQELKTQTSVAGTLKTLTDAKKETSQNETFNLATPAAASKKEMKVMKQNQTNLGGADAGGGANIRGQDGKLLTLTEAGLIFTKNINTAIEAVKSYPSYYIIAADLRQELRDVLDLLPIPDYAKTLTLNSILGDGDRSVFIDARDKMDEKIYSKIKADYQKAITIASAKKMKLTEENFSLPAYSDEKNTFILADFDKLTLRKKALKLIHEYLMRNDVSVSKKLLPVLQFDNTVELYLAGERSESTNLTYTKTMIQITDTVNITDADYAGYANAEYMKYSLRGHPDREKVYNLNVKFQNFYDIYVVRKYETKQRTNALIALLQHLGRPILTSELFLKPSELKYQGRVDMSLAQQFNSIAPMTTLFENAIINVERDLDPKKYRDDLGFKDYETLINDVKVGFNDSKEVSAQKKLVTKQFVNELNLICQNYYALALNSEVPDDGLIYTSEVMPGTYLVKCSGYLSADQRLKGYAFKLTY